MLSTSAPGRVNLIGDHVDYMGGPVLPMAIQFRTTFSGERTGHRIQISSDAVEGRADLALPVRDVGAVEPRWARHVAAVAELVDASVGYDGTIHSDLPVGAGLSSSASLAVAAALALDGPTESARALAELCQRSEQLATGVPCGIMDQMAVVAAQRGHALLLDCSTLAVRHIAIPETATWWVLHSGHERQLAGSAYAERRAQCEAAAALIGPLPLADPSAVSAIEDPTVRRRARHVIEESRRVRAAAAALEDGDLVEFGRLMCDSHRSLRDDFEVSNDALEATVDAAMAVPGVLGARLTGAGFGGCVVVLAHPGAAVQEMIEREGRRGWRVEASSGALELLAEQSRPL